MQIDHIIVQAGGKGTRLEHLTANKPKALVPVENLPMLFHLFRKFPDKRYVIIADYKKDVLRKYLACFANVKYCIVEAAGTGTCSGVRQAAALLPDGVPFMLVWSDLILPDGFALPTEDADFIGISQTFPCRWRYQSGEFAEDRSTEHGVAGLFVFRDKTTLNGVPESGELVRWMRERNFRFSELGLSGTREFGLLSEYEALGQEKCRPFNKITIDGDTVVKEPVDEQGRRLAKLESAWYRTAKEKGVSGIPRIYETEPLRMERIRGKNIYEYTALPLSEKRTILEKLVCTLKELHSKESIPADAFSLRDAYYGKTMARLNQIRDLVPFADRRTITVNGRECRNVFYHQRELEQALERIKCGHFAFIHGDCTFSNMMLREDGTPVLIDPRGYFGRTELYGDPAYDWAKLYYSVVGNYDQFNRKRFDLDIGEDSVTLRIAYNGWEELEPVFFGLLGDDVSPAQIHLLHAIIWLSLTTYAWEDYDSICGAFYNGLYYLEEVLDENVF